MPHSLYPELVKHFKEIKNFDTIRQELPRHFSEIINLEALEEICKAHAQETSSYFQFFSKLLTRLENAYTSQEIIRDTYFYLNSDTLLQESLLVIPAAQQMGFLENLATGRQKPGQPLSLVDMLRTFNSLSKNKNSLAPQILRLRDFIGGTEDDKRALDTFLTNKIVILDLNLSNKNPARWAAVDVFNKKVFCESGILPSEKKAFLHLFKGFVIEEGEARDNASTGYWLINWFDRHYSNSNDCNPESEILGFEKFLKLQFEVTPENRQGKSYAISYENQSYCSKEFIHQLELNQHGTANTFQIHLIERYLSISLLWDLYGIRIEQNDISKVMKLYSDNNAAKDTIEADFIKAKQQDLPGLSFFMRTYPKENPLLKIYPDKALLQLPTIPTSIENFLNVIQFYKEYKQFCTDNSLDFLLSDEVGNKIEEFHAMLANQEESKRGDDPEKTKRIYNEISQLRHKITALLIPTMVYPFLNEKKETLEISWGFLRGEEPKIDDHAIEKSLANNPAVCTVRCTESPLLGNLALTKICARNRFLKQQGYKPAASSDPWLEYAKKLLEFFASYNLLEAPMEDIKNRIYHLKSLPDLTDEKYWGSYVIKNDYSAYEKFWRMQGEPSLYEGYLNVKYSILIPNRFGKKDDSFMVKNTKENSLKLQELIFNDMVKKKYLTRSEPPELYFNNNGHFQKITVYEPEKFNDAFAKHLDDQRKEEYAELGEYYIRNLIELNSQASFVTQEKSLVNFKNTLYQAGVGGLEAFLELLKSEKEEPFVTAVLGEKKPAFFIACGIQEIEEYTAVLAAHIREHNFPFSEVVVKVHDLGSKDKDIPKLYLKLLESLNGPKRFDSIKLVGCLEKNAPTEVKKLSRDITKLEEFLQKLITLAQEKCWVTPIVFPELEKNKKVEYQLLFDTVSELNSVILRNKWLESAKEQLPLIFGPSAIKADKADSEAVPASHEKKNAVESLRKEVRSKSWPVYTSSTSVQVQQQQELASQLTQQCNNSRQQSVARRIEETFIGKTLTYDTIDAVLGEYYRDYTGNHAIDEGAARLGSRDESILQRFFRTWINAQPNTGAEDIIYAITEDAAKLLLEHHQKFTSGVSLANLPKGFYTQRSPEGQLTLCYKPELAYAYEDPTPLTISLEDYPQNPKPWPLSYRFFKEGKTQYPQDIELIKIFSMLQPQKDYRKEVRKFQEDNALWLPSLSPEQEQYAHENWPFCVQIFESFGQEEFKDALERKDVSSPEQGKILEVLAPELEKQARQWILQSPWIKEAILALGQVLLHYGKDGVTNLLNEFYKLSQKIGDARFNKLIIKGLLHCGDWNSCMNKEFIETLREIAASNDENTLNTWFTVLEHHKKSQNTNEITSLWKAFSYFRTELAFMDLSLKGDEFEEVPEENMLVFMDRILGSLKALAQKDLQENFLTHLKDMDLSYGGVHYAVQKDGFKEFRDPSLELRDMSKGSPTYKPNLAAVYQWAPEDLGLYIQRSLASAALFSYQTYKDIQPFFKEETPRNKDALLLLLHTQYNPAEVSVLLNEFKHANAEHWQVLAKAVHTIVYEQGNKRPVLSWDALGKLTEKMPNETLARTIERFPCEFLEAVTILHRSGNWSHLEPLLELFAKADTNKTRWQKEGLKLAALFGASQENFDNFYNTTNILLPIVRQELDILLSQLYSINFEQSNKLALGKGDLLKNLSELLLEMQQNPTQTQGIRIDFMSRLVEKGLCFSYSNTGNYRRLRDKLQDGPHDLASFTDHEDRLWLFLQKHLLVNGAANAEAKEELEPIVAFFKRLQLTRSDLNEIEPMLTCLESLKEGGYWTAAYFNQIITTLQPVDSKMAFPLTILKSLLQEPPIAPKEINQVITALDEGYSLMLKEIINNPAFPRNYQAMLAQLISREYSWSQNFTNMRKILLLLSESPLDPAKKEVPGLLLIAKNRDELEKNTVLCEKLLKQETAPEFSNLWPATVAVWLQALEKQEKALILYNQLEAIETEKQPLVFYILAWSTLSQGKQDKNMYQQGILRKSQRLCEELSKLSIENLTGLAQLYPKEPSPKADSLLKILKKSKAESETIRIHVNEFLCNPYSQLRRDYGQVLASRGSDLERILDETFIVNDENQQNLAAEAKVKIRKSFYHLKEIEEGTRVISGADKSLSKMNKEELVSHLKRVSGETDKQGEVELWAILFEILGRTTGKYPHKAQQLALLMSNEVLGDRSKIFGLGTGEGKSHLIALRAARHALQGKYVDVCTAKRSLIDDFEVYRLFFDYMGISLSRIDPNSNREAYINSRVHISTAGDFSLYLDMQSSKATPIDIPKEMRVGLMDEIDYVLFVEGISSQFNCAIFKDLTPKQMLWFYNAINDFFEADILEPKVMDITPELIDKLKDILKAKADNSPEKTRIFERMKESNLTFVGWLQSAAKAFGLRKGIDYTVHTIPLDLRGDVCEVSQIIPLLGTHPAPDATYSGGVQQLAATKLNKERKKAKKPQDFNVPKESWIIGSKITEHCIEKWWEILEGFTGTISPLQQSQLNDKKISVIGIPSNQRDLRKWNDPSYFSSDEERRIALVKSFKSCLASKKSALMSCNNDQEVETLKEILQKEFTAEEWEQFVFHTNDDQKAAEEVLKTKRIKENWSRNGKAKGVILVASGFGRGDNPEVEEVFITNPNDDNDLKQIGGRTGRNGSKGTVNAYYVTPVLEKEKENLLIELDELDTAREKSLRSTVAGKLEGQPLINQVLLLKEYLAWLRSMRNQAYHSAISQFSDWALAVIPEISNEEVRKNWISMYSASLESFSRQWLDVSADKDLSEEEKIATIITEIQKEALDLSQRIETKASISIQKLSLDLKVRKRPDFAVSRQEIKNRTKNNWEKEAIHQIAIRYAPPENQKLLETDLKKVLTRDEDLGFRRISEGEHLVCQLDKEKTFSFLTSLARVFVGLDQGVFDSLLKQTGDSWKDHSKELLKLWPALSERITYFSKSHNLITKALSYPGKAWLQFLQACLKLPEDSLQKHETRLLELYESLDYKKSKNMKIFSYITRGLREYPNLIDNEVRLENYKKLIIKDIMKQGTDRSQEKLLKTQLDWLLANIKMHGANEALVFEMLEDKISLKALHESFSVHAVLMEWQQKALLQGLQQELWNELNFGDYCQKFAAFSTWMKDKQGLEARMKELRPLRMKEIVEIFENYKEVFDKNPDAAGKMLDYYEKNQNPGLLTEVLCEALTTKKNEAFDFIVEGVDKWLAKTPEELEALKTVLSETQLNKKMVLHTNLIDARTVLIRTYLEEVDNRIEHFYKRNEDRSSKDKPYFDFMKADAFLDSGRLIKFSELLQKEHPDLSIDEGAAATLETQLDWLLANIKTHGANEALVFEMLADKISLPALYAGFSAHEVLVEWQQKALLQGLQQELWNEPHFGDYCQKFAAFSTWMKDKQGLEARMQELAPLQMKEIVEIFEVYKEVFDKNPNAAGKMLDYYENNANPRLLAEILCEALTTKKNEAFDFIVEGVGKWLAKSPEELKTLKTVLSETQLNKEMALHTDLVEARTKLIAIYSEVDDHIENFYKRNEDRSSKDKPYFDFMKADAFLDSGRLIKFSELLQKEHPDLSIDEGAAATLETQLDWLLANIKTHGANEALVFEMLADKISLPALYAGFSAHEVLVEWQQKALLQGLQQELWNEPNFGDYCQKFAEFSAWMKDKQGLEARMQELAPLQMKEIVEIFEHYKEVFEANPDVAGKMLDYYDNANPRLLTEVLCEALTTKKNEAFDFIVEGVDKWLAKSPEELKALKTVLSDTQLNKAMVLHTDLVDARTKLIAIYSEVDDHIENFYKRNEDRSSKDKPYFDFMKVGEFSDSGRLIKFSELLQKAHPDLNIDEGAAATLETQLNWLLANIKTHGANEALVFEMLADKISLPALYAGFSVHAVLMEWQQQALLQGLKDNLWNEPNFGEYCQKFAAFSTWMRTKQGLEARMKNLVPSQMKEIVEIFEYYKEAFDKNPNVAGKMLDYYENNANPRLLTEILCEALTKEPRTQNAFDFLSTGVQKWVNTAADRLSQLKTLLLQQDRRLDTGMLLHTELLSEREALRRHDIGEEEIDAVIDNFYRSNNNASDEHFIEQDIEKYFNFEDPQLKNTRIIWMRLLNQESLVAEDRLVADPSLYYWKKETNDALLKNGFDKYIEEGTRLAKIPSASTQVEKQKQKTGLFHLASELEIIGENTQKTALTAETFNGFKKILVEYHSPFTLFKTSARKKQARDLLNDLQKNQKNMGFREIIESVGKARNAAIESDNKINQGAWLKQNRSGRSRFLRTLNSIEEKVVKAWADSDTDINTFAAYKRINEKEYTDLEKGLKKEMQSYYKEIKTPGCFAFMDSHRKERELLSQEYDKMTPLEFITFAKAARPHLPPHLGVLIDELTQRSFAAPVEKEHPLLEGRLLD